MHDIRFIRENTDAFVKALSRRPAYAMSAKSVAEDVLSADKQLRAVQTGLQEQQASRNEWSKKVGQAKAARDENAASMWLGQVAHLKEAIQAGEQRQRELEAELKGKLAVIPNLPADDVPLGEDEAANTPVPARAFGSPPNLGTNNPKEHFELGETLKMMDFERAVKVSGSRFVYLTSGLAKLNRALASFMLDNHTEHFGYTEVNPPLLVRDDAMFGTGQLPKFEEDLFKTHTAMPEKLNETIIRKAMESMVRDLPKLIDDIEIETGRKLPLQEALKEVSASFGRNTDEYNKMVDEAVVDASRRWLIPTAEVSLTNYVNGEILDEAELPIRFTAYTPCFRSEAGAAGKDTRGMIRMHQFDKVELVSITTPETSNEEHERMTDAAQAILKKLDLHHRVVTLCTGDMGFGAKKTYDIEVWLPGQGRFREISSCSNCGDFQARRMNTRVRGKDGKVKGPAHTLNGSGLAIGRTLIAIMENYQQPDGSIAIPDALQPYMAGKKKIEKA